MHCNLLTDIQVAKETGYEGMEIIGSKLYRYLEQGLSIDDVKKQLDGFPVVAMGYVQDIERQEPEEESSLVEPGDDFVLLMSIHKAKGLEFDAVCLPDLSRECRDDVGPLLTDRLSRRVELSVGTGIRSGGYEELAELERENVLAEQKRLLYVAATRARRLLVLPLYWPKTDRDCMLKLLADTGHFAQPHHVPFGEERGGVFYWDTRMPKEHVVSLERRDERAAEQVSVAELTVRRRQWEEQHDQIVLRASSGPPIILPSELVGGTALPAEWPSEEGAGREFGSLFHNVMRRMPLKAAAAGDEELEALVSGLAAMEAAAAGLEDEAAQRAARLAVGLMENQEFHELVRGAEVVLQEAPFAVPLSKLPFFDAEVDGLLEGRIDLLLMGRDRTVVLDYKTDRVDEKRASEVASRYWPQLALYVLALQACGWLRARSELVLCFVRACSMHTRELDTALLGETGKRLKQALSGAGGGTITLQ